MVHLYSAFNQGALHRLCISFTHSHTHSYTDGGGNHARHQPAHREQLGVQSLAQRLFNITRGEPGIELGTLHVLRRQLYHWATAAPLTWSQCMGFKTGKIILYVPSFRSWFVFELKEVLSHPSLVVWNGGHQDLCHQKTQPYKVGGQLNNNNIALSSDNRAKL